MRRATISITDRPPNTQSATQNFSSVPGNRCLGIPVGSAKWCKTGLADWQFSPPAKMNGLLNVGPGKSAANDRIWVSRLPEPTVDRAFQHLFRSIIGELNSVSHGTRLTTSTLNLASTVEAPLRKSAYPSWATETFINQVVVVRSSTQDSDLTKRQRRSTLFQKVSRNVPDDMLSLLDKLDREKFSIGRSSDR